MIPSNSYTAEHLPYATYIHLARQDALRVPPTASERAESLFGFHSALLAAKHLPRAEADAPLADLFHAALGQALDLSLGIPLLAPERIENAALLTSLLLRAYQSEPATGAEYLRLADLAAEDLLRRQGEDGAYRNGREHKSVAAHIIKTLFELSMTELTLADADATMARRAVRHYSSAAAAAKNLLAIYTGECDEALPVSGSTALLAAVQLAFYALTLKSEDRLPYLTVAEGLLAKEEPTAVTEQGLLTVYAGYYLYLLTGKEAWLRRALNALSPALKEIAEGKHLTPLHHAHVACLAETLYQKAFVSLSHEGLYAHGCRAYLTEDTLTVSYAQPILYLHLTLSRPLTLVTPTFSRHLAAGRVMLNERGEEVNPIAPYERYSPLAE